MQSGLINTESLLDEFFQYVKDNDIRSFAFDTETTGLHGPICGFSLGDDMGCGWYFPMDHRTLFDTDQISMSMFKSYFDEFFSDPENTFMGWNLGYDIQVLWRSGLTGISDQSILDAQVLGWLIDENKTKSLKPRATEEGVTDSSIKYNEIVGKKKFFSDIPYEMAAEYAIQDVILPRKLWNKFVNVLKTTGRSKLLKHYYEEQQRFCRVLAGMSFEGIRLNPKKVLKFKKEMFVRLRELERDIYKEAGEEFTISSPKQRQYILYTKLKLPVGGHTPKGDPSTDAKAMEVLDKRGYPIAKKIVEYGKCSKLIDSFTDKLIDMCDKTGRIHSSFNGTGTVTGRLSSQDPNLQNIPAAKALRDAFEADLKEDEVLIIGDYSQLELRMLAHFSQDKVMMEAFLNGRDLHTTTAAYAFEVLYEDVLKEQRRKAKTVNFGIVYGMGAREDMGIDEAFIDRWYKVHSGAKSYIDAHYRFVKKHKWTQTISGRYRTVPEVDSTLKGEAGKAQRAAFSAHIQGSGADVVRKAMLDFDEQRIKIPGLRLLLQVHDELMVTCKRKYAEDAQELLKSCMENSYKLRVPLVVDPVIGSSWACKE